MLKHKRAAATRHSVACYIILTYDHSRITSNPSKPWQQPTITQAHSGQFTTEYDVPLYGQYAVASREF